eukprot:TRINITY_DN15261_c0_g1_i1.p1 TRINITY_DN15261_c0_g1~~TRINITY_DN15261_c0_g1_i1.p1  ORF type:complete len:178 (+),score=41.57 TRINITY_DN15261_c0_g1_i1:27-536(+)
MTQKQFIRNNQGFNGGGDLPIDYQQELYSRIVGEEIKMERELVRFPNSIKKGWAHIYCKNISSAWKRRYIVLSDNCIFIFKKQETHTTEPPSHGIILRDVIITTVSKIKNKKGIIKIHLPVSTIKYKDVPDFVITGSIGGKNDPKSEHILICPERDVIKWAKALNAFKI